MLGERKLDEAPAYYYLRAVNGKLMGVSDYRVFGFTKYVKMDESYLSGCFLINGKRVNGMTDELLTYARNEIYASYHYKFPDQRWQDLFENTFAREDDKLLKNVDDSLTAIDKYNIAWINKKLNKVPKINILAVK